MPDIGMRLGRDTIVVEGGMGTMLERYGVAGEACPELLNLTAPDLIEEIHRYYHMAGAQCAVSNTYGGSADRMAALGHAADMERANLEGVRLAQSARPQHVLANMGPCTLHAGDPDGGAYAEARGLYEEQARVLASAGPDAIFIQTMTDIRDAVCAVEGARRAGDLPVIASCAFRADGTMPGCGTGIGRAAEALAEAGADVVGINCLLGPEEMLPLAAELAAASPVPVLAMPDVSAPVKRRGRMGYEGSPDLMASVAYRMRAAGVQLIGTCCGSTPAYTGAVFAAVGGTDAVEPKRP